MSNSPFGSGNTAGLIACGFAILIVLIIAWVSKRKHNTKEADEYVPAPTVWYAVKIEVTYLNDKTEQFDLEVYDSPANIRLFKGDVTYSKTTKKTGGVVSVGATAASYVRSFRIISSVKHVINE